MLNKLTHGIFEQGVNKLKHNKILQTTIRLKGETYKLEQWTSKIPEVETQILKMILHRVSTSKTYLKEYMDSLEKVKYLSRKIKTFQKT